MRNSVNVTLKFSAEFSERGFQWMWHGNYVETQHLANTFRFFRVDSLHREKDSCCTNGKCICYLPLVISSLCWKVFGFLWFKCIVPRRHVRKGVWSKVIMRSLECHDYRQLLRWTFESFFQLRIGWRFNLPSNPFLSESVHWLQDTSSPINC